MKVRLLTAVTILFSLCVCAQASHLKMPDWKVGDSWKVKVNIPLVATEDGGRSFSVSDKFSTSTYQMRVQGVENHGKDKCYVISITGPEEVTEESDRKEVYAFYRTKDLSLQRVKFMDWTRDGKRCEHNYTAEDGQTLVVYDETAMPFPLVLPTFPLESGESNQLYYDEPCKSKNRVKNNPYLDGFLSDSVSVSTEDVTSADGKGIDPGSIKAVFKRSWKRSGPGSGEKNELEQIWSPGKKWWSVAAVKPNGPLIWHCVMIEESTGKKPGKVK